MTRSASGRTLDFADRRGTLEGSQTLRKARKLTKIDGKLLRRRFANERRGKKSIFALPGATWRRFWRLRSIPGCSRALLMASRVALGIPGRSWGPSGRSRGVTGAPRDASKTLPGCLPNALGHHGASREGRGIDFESILGAPGQLRAAPGTDLESIFV